MSNSKKTGRTQDKPGHWPGSLPDVSRHSVMRFRIFWPPLCWCCRNRCCRFVAESMRSGIADNGRMLLGGDFELSSLHVAPDKNC